MKINKQRLYDFFTDNDIDYLYHANTVATTTTFLEEGGLLSRGEVERRGLNQTEQRSDYIDKKYKVWNDIFLDAYDIHLGGCDSNNRIYYRENIYGPILLKLRKELLLGDKLPDIWITRDNPTEWNKLISKGLDTYIDLDEYKEIFGKKTYKRMITIKADDYIIDFKDYLEEIIIDDGVEVNGVNYSEIAYSVIANVLKRRNIKCKITMRDCNRTCWCIQNYNDKFENQLECLFLMQ